MCVLLSPRPGAFAGCSSRQALPLGQRVAGQREGQGWSRPAARATPMRGQPGAWTWGLWGQRLLAGSGPGAAAQFLESCSEESGSPVRVCARAHTHTPGYSTHIAHQFTHFLWGDSLLGLNSRSPIQSAPASVRITGTTVGSQRPSECGDCAQEAGRATVTMCPGHRATAGLCGICI